MRWNLWLLASMIMSTACQSSETRPVVLTGLVEAKEIDVASKLPGRITEVVVEEGDDVQEGQVLVRLELDALEMRLAQASSYVKATQRQVDLAQAGPRDSLKRSAAAAVQAAEQEVVSTQKMAERGRALVEKQAMGKAQLEQLELAHELAKAQLAIAKEHLKALNEGARPEELESLASMAEGAVSARDLVSSLLREKEQVAPRAAEVAKIHVSEGELSGIGFPLITLVDLGEIWAVFAVREDHLKGLRKGEKRKLYVPALDREVSAEVQHIAALGDFATWRATSASDSFDLKSFEVRMKLSEKEVPGLRPGMTIRWTLGEG